jgi:hypothetical protein
VLPAAAQANRMQGNPIALTHQELTSSLGAVL